MAEHELAKVKTKDQLIAEKFPRLRGQGITLSEAADMYDVPRSAIKNWVYRNEYIRFVDTASYPQLIDEAEVAYCAEVYHSRKEKGIVGGIPLLGDDGLPYDELKHPELSERRRSKRKAA